MSDDQIKSAEQLAKEALEEADAEVESSNKVAETLGTLQNLIERHALNLEEIRKQIKETNESLRSVFENDTTLSTAQEEAQAVTSKVKERRSQLQSDPQVTSLKIKVGELKEQQKELEETLSNHLINYHSLTNSKSFDTSDGDQWDFSIRAKIRPRGKK
jgi:DNA repair ATPase RecN